MDRPPSLMKGKYTNRIKRYKGSYSSINIYSNLAHMGECCGMGPHYGTPSDHLIHPAANEIYIGGRVATRNIYESQTMVLVGDPILSLFHFFVFKKKSDF
jgi:hypothetical protein